MYNILIKYIQITHYMKIMRFFYAFIHPVRQRTHERSNIHEFLNSQISFKLNTGFCNHNEVVLSRCHLGQL